MIGRYATKLAVWLLTHGRLGNEERQLLTATILDRLGALPIRAKVVVDGAGRISIGGNKMTFEAAKAAQSAAQALLKNFAYKVVREQVTYMAIQKGVHENNTPEQGLFAKAALWYMQEERELYLMLAQLEVEEDDQ